MRGGDFGFGMIGLEISVAEVISEDEENIWFFVGDEGEGAEGKGREEFHSIRLAN